MKGTKKHIVLSAITLAIVLIFGAGIAYAWFTTDIDVSVSASIKTEAGLLVLEGSTPASAWTFSDLAPAGKNGDSAAYVADDTGDMDTDDRVQKKTYTVKAATDTPTPVFIYASYDNDDDSIASKIMILVVIDSTPGSIASPGVAANTTQLGTKAGLTTSVTAEVKIYVWLDGPSVNNYDMGKSLSFTFHFETEARA